MPQTRNVFRVVEKTVIPAFSQVVVKVKSNVDGLIHVEPKPSVFTRKLVRAANGVDEVRRDVCPSER